MKADIIKLLIEYSDKKADKGFVKRVVAMFLKNFGIEEYVKGVVFTRANCSEDISENMPACFDMFQRVLTIDLKAIYNICDENRDLLITSQDRLFYYNLKVLEIVIHELYHAFQIKTFVEGTNKLDKEIYSITWGPLYKCLKDNIDIFDAENIHLMNYVQYLHLFIFSSDELYEKIPYERMAHIYATGTAQRTGEFNRYNCPNACNLMSFEHYNKLLSGYDSESPTAEIMTFINTYKGMFGFKHGSIEYEDNLKRCEELKKKYKLTAVKSLYYGLPTSDFAKSYFQRKKDALENVLKR